MSGNCIRRLNIQPARDTPQHNHLVEVGLATINDRGRAMMLDANIPEKLKPNVAKKAFETATKLDGLILVKIDDVYKTRVKHFEGSIPPFAERLMLLKTIYGLKQSAFEYWRVLLKAMRGLGLLRSKADPKYAGRLLHLLSYSEIVRLILVT